MTQTPSATTTGATTACTYCGSTSDVTPSGICRSCIVEDRVVSQ